MTNLNTTFTTTLSTITTAPVNKVSDINASMFEQMMNIKSEAETTSVPHNELRMKLETIAASSMNATITSDLSIYTNDRETMSMTERMFAQLTGLSTGKPATAVPYNELQMNLAIAAA